MTRLSTPVLALLLAAAAAPACGQTRARAPLALQLPASARAAALGNAFPLASADADVLFYHPAQLTGARGLAGTLAAYGSSSLLLTVAAAAEWWGGGLGIGIQATSYGAFTLDEGAYGRGEAGLGEAGPLATSELVGSAGYGRAFFGFRVGLVGKIAEERVAGERDVTVAADIGVARALGSVTLALSAQNVGRDPELDSLDARLPQTFTLAAATPGRPTGPFDIALAASLSRWEDGTFVPAGGAEIAWWPVPGRTISARIGARWVEDSDIFPLTLGAGFTGDRVSIDYAFADHDHGDPVHRVGIRMR
jgi:hypothetical protein